MRAKETKTAAEREAVMAEWATSRAHDAAKVATATAASPVTYAMRSTRSHAAHDVLCECQLCELGRGNYSESSYDADEAV